MNWFKSNTVLNFDHFSNFYYLHSSQHIFTHIFKSWFYFKEMFLFIPLFVRKIATTPIDDHDGQIETEQNYSSSECWVLVTDVESSTTNLPCLSLLKSSCCLVSSFQCASYLCWESRFSSWQWDNKSVLREVIKLYIFRKSVWYLFVSSTKVWSLVMLCRWIAILWVKFLSI